MTAFAMQTLGAALLHFLWQGTALALLLFLALSFTRNPRLRYGLAVCTLVLLALCPLATVVLLQRVSAAPAPLSHASVSAPISNVAILSLSVALPSAGPATSLNWLACLVWLWCSGVVVFGVRAFGGWIVLQNLRRTARETISPVLLQTCRRLEKRIGIATLVRYAHSEIVDAPAVVGWLRPVVLIPLSALAGLSPEQLEAIVAHELAHIRRHDALVNLFQIAVETVLFYHPAVWWVNHILRQERENCCDDIAVAVCGNPREYVRALTILGAKAARPAWAMAANGGVLKSRIGRLLGLRQMAPGIPRAGLAVLAVLCASCVVWAAGVFKQDVPATPPPSPPPPAAPAVPLPPESSAPPPNLANTYRQIKDLERRLADHDKAPLHPPAEAAQWEFDREIRDLEADIASMERRYTHDYPNLRSARDRVAILARLRSELPQTAPSDQKAEEHSGSYIDSLESVGLTKLTVDELLDLKIQGVTADYVRQVKATGLNPSVHELIGLKVQGVTPEYIRDIRATGLKPGLHDLLAMKVQGVTPEFIRALQAAGLGALEMHDFISAKVQGITPEFIDKVRSHGFKDLTIHQLIGLKVAGVF
jgi:beta-lactamase regulating signal transducer with metallopeptidase domain